MEEFMARNVAEDLVEIVVRGDVDVMTTKYQVSVNLARERILSEAYWNRERAEEVKEECINTLTERFSS